MINWDQRGAGKSYGAVGDKDSMTIEQFDLDRGHAADDYVVHRRRHDVERLDARDGRAPTTTPAISGTTAVSGTTSPLLTEPDPLTGSTSGSISAC